MTSSAQETALADYEAPIHFRWPEHVTTKRSRAWWFPTEAQN